VRLDEELTRMAGMGITVHLLADGAALVLLPDGAGRLWTSRDDLFRRVRRAMDAVETGADEMAQLTPSDESFAAQVPELIARLPGQLGLDVEVLNLTEKSLAAVDTVIRKAGQERVLTPDLFPALVAYVGEVIRVAIAGTWEVRYDDRRRCWEPFVVFPDGAEYAALSIYDEILENGRRASLEAVAHVAIASGRNCRL
jgi:hypothetical protein